MSTASTETRPAFGRAPTIKGMNMTTNMNEVQRTIVRVCGHLQELLLAKNKAYGNSALEPLRIFSKASADEQLKVRIDDKLSRIALGEETDKVPEQTVWDLAGYLVLYLVWEELTADKPVDDCEKKPDPVRAQPIPPAALQPRSHKGIIGE